MEVVVNGQTEQVADACNVCELLARRQLSPGRVAIEINQRLVPRGHYEATRLRPGDHVEIVTFVGGG